MGKKLLPEYTDAELFQFLEESQEVLNSEAQEIIIKEPRDVFQFLSIYKILPGVHKVLHKLLYSLYRNWSEKPVEPIAFSNEIKKFLPFIMRSQNLYYLVNEKDLTLLSKSYIIINKTTSRKTINPRSFEHLTKFIKTFQIESGDFWIETETLYTLYDKWAYTSKRKRPMTYPIFSKVIRIFPFKTKLTAGFITWIALDKSILNHIKEDKIIELRNWYVEKKKNKKRKK